MTSKVITKNTQMKINNFLKFIKFWLMGLGVFYIINATISPFLGSEQNFKFFLYLFVAFGLSVVIYKSQNRQNSNHSYKTNKKTFDFFFTLLGFMGIFCLCHFIFESNVGNNTLYYLIALASSVTLSACWLFLCKNKYQISGVFDYKNQKISFLTICVFFIVIFLCSIGWFYFLCMPLNFMQNESYVPFIFLILGCLLISVMGVILHIRNLKRKVNRPKHSNFIAITFMLMGICVIFGEIFENTIGDKKHLYSVTTLGVSMVLSICYLYLCKPKATELGKMDE